MTCLVDGCDAPVHSRGWCQPHYGRWHRHGDPLWQPIRKALIKATCEACHEPFTYMPYPSQPIQRCCTQSCASRLKARTFNPMGEPDELARRRRLRDQRTWARWWERQRRIEDRRELRTWKPKTWPQCRVVDRPEPRVFIGRVCVACGATWVSYVAMPDTDHCAPCNRKRWKAGHRARARKYGGSYTYIAPKVIFDRDGYRCQLCGVKTKGAAPHPRAPTLDHIIPLALGGDHSESNLQCACWACNVRKGSGAANDQLRLAVAA